MAARTRRITQNDRTRQKIKVGLLIKKLSDHVLEGKPLENSQVRSADILLKKALPDLTAVELSGEGGGPLVVEIVKLANSPTS